MKKIVLLSAVLTFGAQANVEEISAKDVVEGFYAGLGVCWNHSINKIGATNGVLDNDGIPNDWFGYEVCHKKSDKLGGALVSGYGMFVTGNFYFGGELNLDIAGNKTTNSEYQYTNNAFPYYAKVKGFVPTIAFRFGGWCPCVDGLIYTKIGIAFVRAEFQEKHPDVFNDVRKISKMAPVLGLGFEKNICCNANIRVEGDYRFQVKKVDKTRNLNGINWCNVENRVKGFTIRLMVAYKLHS